MDLAVGLVQAYLRVNGYFTVTEFPVVESADDHGYRAATDVDILACRFPNAVREVVGTPHRRPHPDPALATPTDTVDMIVGEVKESRAAFNEPSLRPEVLAATLARFGCCPPGHAGGLVAQLLTKGSTRTPAGHHLRLVAFGASDSESHRYTTISLGQVHAYLEAFVREHWDALKAIPSKDPALGWVMLREKLRRAKT